MAIGDLVYVQVSVGAGVSVTVQPPTGVRWKMFFFLPNNPGATDLSLSFFQPGNSTGTGTLAAGVIQPLYNMILDNTDYVAVENPGTTTQVGLFTGIVVA